MFKDYDKYLSTSLKVYLLVLIILVILKLVGINYFKLDIGNPILFSIDDFLSKYKIDYVYQCLCLYFNFYLIRSITLKEYKFNLDVIIVPTINIVMFFTLKNFNLENLYQITNISLLFAYFIIKKVKLKRIVGVFIINLLCQWFSVIIRNYNIQDYDNILFNALMNIDYYIMLLILYNIEKQGGVKLCQVVGSYSLKKINLSNLLKRLQRNYHNFKKLNKETKLTYAIYFILSLIWNTATLVIILAIASLNDTLIECLFILTSFWLSKRTFGKAFHLPSMIQCFIVSNLTYYALNRITTPIGISIIVPILLGVGLSYVTSKLVKKMYKPLYRGMPEGVFEETITKVVEKDSYKYKICYDYFIKKESALKLSYKYNYSEAGIRKIKDRVNIAIKELNK